MRRVDFVFRNELSVSNATSVPLSLPRWHGPCQSVPRAAANNVAMADREISVRLPSGFQMSISVFCGVSVGRSNRSGGKSRAASRIELAEIALTKSAASSGHAADRQSKPVCKQAAWRKAKTSCGRPSCTRSSKTLAARDESQLRPRRDKWVDPASANASSTTTALPAMRRQRPAPTPGENTAKRPPDAPRIWSIASTSSVCGRARPASGFWRAGTEQSRHAGEHLRANRAASPSARSDWMRPELQVFAAAFDRQHVD